MACKPSEQANMLMSMAYLDQILLVSSTVEAVEVTRRASTWSWFALPTDVASPCVHCFREAGSCLSVRTACVVRVRACLFLLTRMIHRRGFSTLVLFISSAVDKPALLHCKNRLSHLDDYLLQHVLHHYYPELLL